jgi:hypothetical protein
MILAVHWQPAAAAAPSNFASRTGFSETRESDANRFLEACEARQPEWFTFLVGSVLLWIPMSMLVNVSCVYAMPLGLTPWKKPGRERRNAATLELFNNRPK